MNDIRVRKGKKDILVNYIKVKTLFWPLHLEVPINLVSIFW